jgi:hypothetical protein
MPGGWQRNIAPDILPALTMVEGDAMNEIVRRVTRREVRTRDSDHLLPEKLHRKGPIAVTSQVTLGIEPKLYLAWSIEDWYWTQGYTLMVFHSTTGFSPERYPEDLNRHGQLIIETTQDASREEHPEEGTHYYSFVLHKRHLVVFESMDVLRFSETIPSAKVPIGRIKDQMELEEMRRRHDLSEIEHEANLNDAAIRRIRSREKLALAQEPPKLKRSGADAVIAEELSAIDAMVEAAIAKRRKVEDLKADPRFLSLSAKEREAILKRIEERLDAGEMSARRDMRQ